MPSNKRDTSTADSADAQTAASSSSARPPKRSRKAVNCEPCRASKLKCDRKRPCSGCEIRGITDQCYAEEGAVTGKEELTVSTLDVRTELEKMKASLRVLESALPRHVDFTTTLRGGSNISYDGDPLLSNPLAPKDLNASLLGGWERFSPESQVNVIPLYVGPAAAPIAHLIGRNEETGLPESINPHNPPHLLDRNENYPLFEEYRSLPNNDILVDRLLHFFFDNCTYLIRILDPVSWFESAWSAECARARINAGRSASGPTGVREDHDGPEADGRTDVLTLSAAYMMIAIAMNYIPEGDSIISHLPPEMTALELGRRWYAAALRCIARYRVLRAPPSLEYVEVLLLRCHYLSVAETLPSEAWTVKADLSGAVMALALHRDPGAWRIPAGEIERRRWAWWNFLTFERWQAFVYGRPLTVQSAHFNTKFPSPSLDPSSSSATVRENPHLLHLAFFRLIAILGDILTDILPAQPQHPAMTYERAKQHNAALERWASDTLPWDLRLDLSESEGPEGPGVGIPGVGVSVSRGLTLSTPVRLRFSVLQAVFLRIRMEQIRQALFQQFVPARVAACEGDFLASGWNGAMGDGSAAAECLSFAVRAAGTVIDVLRQMIPMCSSNLFLALPGHTAWSENALFSSGIFFSSLLLTHSNSTSTSQNSILSSNPAHHPSRNSFRTYVQSSIQLLAQLELFVPHSSNARVVLQAIAPLFNEDLHLSEEARAEQVDAIRGLPFPSMQCSLWGLTGNRHDVDGDEAMGDGGSMNGNGNGRGRGGKAGGRVKQEQQMGGEIMLLPHPARGINGQGDANHDEEYGMDAEDEDGTPEANGLTAVAGFSSMAPAPQHQPPSTTARAPSMDGSLATSAPQYFSNDVSLDGGFSFVRTSSVQSEEPPPFTHMGPASTSTGGSVYAQHSHQPQHPQHDARPSTAMPYDASGPGYASEQPANFANGYGTSAPRPSTSYHPSYGSYEQSPSAPMPIHGHTTQPPSNYTTSQPPSDQTQYRFAPPSQAQHHYPSSGGMDGKSTGEGRTQDPYAQQQQQQHQSSGSGVSYGAASGGEVAPTPWASHEQYWS